MHIEDDKENRHGDYCIPMISDLKCIHADDDRVVRCNYYDPVI